MMSVDEIKLFRVLCVEITRLATRATMDIPQLRDTYAEVMHPYREGLLPDERVTANEPDGLREAAVLVRERTGCSLMEAMDRVKRYRAAWGTL